MCPVVFLALILSFLLFFFEVAAAFAAIFNPAQIYQLKEGDQRKVTFSILNDQEDPSCMYEIVSDDPSIASIADNSTFYCNTSVIEDRTFINGSFLVQGNFLGYTSIRVRNKNNRESNYSSTLPVSIVRRKRAIATAFTVSVAILVSLNYVNMGCVLDIKVVKSVLKKPIAPILGFVCQFVIMPLIAYAVAMLLFDQKVLQLGMFIFGCSPGGGASNMWTVLLKGNLNLSLTMTYISTKAALIMMPLWLFTLGRNLFSGSASQLPYFNIFIALISMLIPLGIGLLFQRYLPRVANFCRRILAPFSIVMIIYIIIFGTYANLYMFRLFSMPIILGATINVWLGFLFGGVCSRIIGLPTADIVAIAIETGIQNTGIAIVLLGVSLPRPDADLASVVPVAASIMTPFPLIVVLCIQKMHAYCRKKKGASGFVLDDNDMEKTKVLATPTSTNSLFDTSA